MMNKVEKELVWAKETIEGMKNAEDLLRYEKYWQQFLGHIGKIQKYCIGEQRNTIKVPKFIVSVNRIASNDELLIYLREARNTKEHTISDNVSVNPSCTKVTAGLGGGKIFSGKVDGAGKNTELNHDGNIQITFEPARLRIIEVKNRSGETLIPPTIHLGNAINTNIPHEIAELAIEFYDENLILD